MGPQQRSGHQGPAELLEDEDRLAATEADAAIGLGQTQGEHTSVGQTTPQVTVHAAVGLQRPDGGHRVRTGAQLAHRVLQRLLVLAELEVHVAPRLRAAQRSRGKPRTRSPRMLRWIWEVPAAMEIDMAWTQPCTCSPL